MRQAAPQQPPDPEKLITGLPGPAQAWLREHPEFVTDPAQNTQLQAAHNYLLARRGVEQFSPEYFRALDAEFGFKATPASEAPQQLPDGAIQKLSSPAPAMTAPPPAPPRRSMPLSAPVARDAPGLGGQRVADARQVTLSPEERQIARNSFTDPGMSNEQKELLYAQNKVQISAAHGVGRVHRREASAVTRRRHPGWLDAPQVWVPLVACDDYEVRGFLEAEFLNFCMDVLSADEAFQAARAVFGDRRCESVEFWTH